MNIRNIAQIINLHRTIIKSQHYSSSEKKVSYRTILNSIRNFNTEVLDDHLTCLSYINELIADADMQPIRDDLKKQIMSRMKLDLVYHEETVKEDELEKKAVKAVRQHLNKFEKFKDLYHNIHFICNNQTDTKLICVHMKDGSTFRHSVGSRTYEQIMKYAAKIAYKMTEEFYQ